MINKKKKGGMAKRYESSYAKREGGGTSKGGVINYRKCDGEITFFNPVEGKNRINIIPYEIKSKNHPLVKSGEAEIGEKDYVLDFYTHRGVGPSEKTVLCLKNTYGKPCPICEYSASLRKAGKEEEAKALKASRRVVFNVEDLKEPGKLKVFETSHFLFEKELIEESRDDDEGGFIDFADEEEGKEIKFRATKVKKGDMEFMEFKSFGFEDRDEPLSEKLLNSAISFDELLTVPSYEEVEKTLYGDDDSTDEDEPEEKPVKKTSKKVDEEDSDDEDELDEEEEEKPAPKKSAKKSAPEPEDEEEEDSDDEEEELPSKSSKKKDCSEDCEKCPYGHKFGKDCDEHDDCDDCELWNKCVKAN